jgi:hypothetical protein
MRAGPSRCPGWPTTAPSHRPSPPQTTAPLARLWRRARPRRVPRAAPHRRRDPRQEVGQRCAAPATMLTDRAASVVRQPHHRAATTGAPLGQKKSLRASRRCGAGPRWRGPARGRRRSWLTGLNREATIRRDRQRDGVSTARVAPDHRHDAPTAPAVVLPCALLSRWSASPPPLVRRMGIIHGVASAVLSFAPASCPSTGRLAGPSSDGMRAGLRRAVARARWAVVGTIARCARRSRGAAVPTTSDWPWAHGVAGHLVLPDIDALGDDLRDLITREACQRRRAERLTDDIRASGGRWRRWAAVHAAERFVARSERY